MRSEVNRGVHLMMKSSLLLSALAICLCSAFNLEPQSPSSSSRRHVLEKAAAGVFSAAFGLVQVSPPALAIEACPPKTKNCIRTTWTAPSGTKNVADSFKNLLAGYPQEGQSGVDLGGWNVFDNENRYEYKSGIGNFAKFFNGGEPFVDDLKFEVDGEKVEIRSSSRIGESDLGVNQKRLKYLADAAKKAGWQAPEPSY